MLDECVHWQVWLNLSQNSLGKLIIVLRRHEEQVVALTADEWNALHKQVRLMTARLRAACTPTTSRNPSGISFSLTQSFH